MRHRLERGICSLCKRDVAVRPPRGGDGTALLPVPHTRYDSKSGKAIRCEGRYFEANRLMPGELAALSNSEGTKE